MFDLVRLIYNSKATFHWSPEETGVQPEVIDILREAREFNREARITGVLFFADGYFFQCLEGRRKVVLPLVERIEKDARHSNFKISFCRSARRRRFKDWTMKFVPMDDAVRDYLKSKDYSEFKPEELTESEINDLVQFFTKMNDTSLVDPELRQSHRSKVGFWQKLFTGGALNTI